MKTETVDIHDLAYDPANVRRHDRRNLDVIKGSLVRFKQQTPLVVDQDGIVRKGNGTLEAARELGWQEIAIVRTTLTGAEATAYSIADNRSGTLSQWDDDALAKTLESLDDDLKLAAGWDGTETAQLLARLDGEVVPGNPSEQWQGMPEFEQEDKTATQAIHVHFKTREDVDRFAILVGQGITENTRSIWFPRIEIETYADKRYADES